MRRKAPYMALVVALTAGACLLLLWWRAHLSAPAPGAAARRPPCDIPGTTLDEPTVRALLPHLEGSRWLVFDPVTIVRVLPDRSSVARLPEHPDGEFTIRTNNRGFREDRPTAPQKSGPRVLVLGDSHTFGLVNNAETFANLLEQRLAARLAGGVEVINAAVSGTGPWEHHALLQELIALQPDLVLAVLFTGNDFINAMAFSDFFTKRRWPELPREQNHRFEEVRAVARKILTQGLGQAFDFAHRPQNAQVGLRATVERFALMADLCREHGASFLAVALPTKDEVDEDDLATQRHLIEGLAMSPTDCASNRSVTLDFLQAMAERAIPALDLLPALQPRTEALYWRSDYHLGVAGHAAVAEALEEPVLGLLHRPR